jgi:excinuclease ABC subunit B
VAREIKKLEKAMLDHARNLEFEEAARARDQLAQLRQQVFGAGPGDNVVPLDGNRAA